MAVVHGSAHRRRPGAWRCGRRSIRTRFLDVPSRDALAQPRRDRSLRAGLDVQGDHGRRRARGGRGPARRPHLRPRTARSRSPTTTIHDWKKYGWLTFAEVLQNSSNVGSIKVGLSLGRERYYRYITAFGFGAPDRRRPGRREPRPAPRDPQRWSRLSLPTMSIGQEISVTALQMVAAFGAIANGGTLMQPRSSARCSTPRAGRPGAFEPKRGAPGHLARRPRARSPGLMTQVVASGTGHNAAIPGYDVAGKTGTAQKLDPATRRYSRDPGVLSFVGFVPADEPRLAMLVMLDEPKNEKWGSEAAAPDLRGDRPRGAALPRRAAARRHAGADRRPDRPAETAAARACGRPARERRGAAAADGARRCRTCAAGRCVRRWPRWPRSDVRRQGGRPRPVVAPGAGRPASRCRPRRCRAADVLASAACEMTCRGMTCR